MLGTCADAASTARVRLRCPARNVTERLSRATNVAYTGPTSISTNSFQDTHGNCISYTYNKSIERARRGSLQRGKLMRSTARASSGSFAENYVSIPKAGGYEQLKVH